MSKVNIFSQDLNRMSREPIGGLSLKQIRQQVIDNLQGKRSVRVDYRKMRADQRGREDDEPTGQETLEIVEVMKYFTVVRRHGYTTGYKLCKDIRTELATGKIYAPGSKG